MGVGLQPPSTAHRHQSPAAHSGPSSLLRKLSDGTRVRSRPTGDDVQGYDYRCRECKTLYTRLPLDEVQTLNRDTSARIEGKIKKDDWRGAHDRLAKLDKMIASKIGAGQGSAPL